MMSPEALNDPPADTSPQRRVGAPEQPPPSCLAGVVTALQTLVERGDSLRRDRRFDWPEAIQQIAGRLLLAHTSPDTPPLVALLGGASAGKSTIFNNFLGGHIASRVAARGHTTLGPILAAHERHRPPLERLLAQKRLFPGLTRSTADIDDNICGQIGGVAVVFHEVASLEGVVLVDLPDFTSEAARVEGDIAMSLLPWFDRIIVVVDHERWFDRQSISRLRGESVRLGQDRWVLFNRTKESPLGDSDRQALAQQAERLAAVGMTVLEFRRGRGFLHFPPGTLDDVVSFLSGAGPDRSAALLARLAEAAGHLLNQNEERAARVRELGEALTAAAARTTPSDRECMTAMMTAEERRCLEPVARTLRLHETSDWIASQARRIQAAMTRVPLVGPWLGSPGSAAVPTDAPGGGRREVGLRFCESVRRRQTNEINATTAGSTFWDEIRRWTKAEPTPRAPDPRKPEAAAFGEAIDRFNGAIAAWTKRVADECHGMAPNVKGALGLGAIGLAIVLIAAPGPVAALTLVSAKTAIGAALGQLLAATGAGAVFGKPMGRLLSIVQERLVGSAELAAVNQAAAALRDRLRAAGMDDVEAAVAEASALVLPEGDPLRYALEQLSGASDGREVRP